MEYYLSYMDKTHKICHCTKNFIKKQLIILLPHCFVVYLVARVEKLNAVQNRELKSEAVMETNYETSPDVYEMKDIFHNKNSKESEEEIKSYAILENLYSIESPSSQNKSETKPKEPGSGEKQSEEIQTKIKQDPDDLLREVSSRNHRSSMTNS
jgi:hypothetical protein